MAQQEAMFDIFVSYRRTNVDFAQTLAENFKQRRRSFWMDTQNIPPAVGDWSEEIERGIISANAFIPILSNDYFESKNCINELRYAHDINKRIIPIVYEKFDNMPDDIRDIIGHINWIYFVPHAGQENTFEDAFALILEALESDYSYIREHTRLLQLATVWDTNKRPNSALLRGDQLQQAEDWRDSGLEKKPRPDQLHLEFITESRKLENRRRQQLLTGVSVAFGITVILTIISLFLFNEANNQRATAETQTALEAIARNTAVKSAELEAIARATAVRSAQESNAFALADASQLALETGKTDLALILALEAAHLDNPPPLVESAVIVATFAEGTNQIFTGLNDVGASIAVSPDKQLVAVGGGIDGDLVLYDATTGEIINTTNLAMFLNLGTLSAIQFSKDGQYLFISTGANTIKWDIDAWQEVWRVDELGVFDVTELILHPAGDLLITAGGCTGGFLAPNNCPRGDIALRNAETGEIVAQLVGHPSSVTAVAISTDGELLASGDTTGNVIIWDISTQTPLLISDNYPSEYVRDLSFSPDGQYLVASSEVLEEFDEYLRLWNAETGNLLNEVSLHNGYEALQFAPNGQALYAGGFDNTIDILSVPDLLQIKTLTGHTGALQELVLSEDNRNLYSIDYSGMARSWVVGNPLRAAVKDYEVSLGGVAYAPDGQYIAVAIQDGTVILLDAVTYDEIWRYEDSENPQEYVEVQYSHDGTKIFAIDDYVRAWDSATGDLLWQTDLQGRFIISLAQSPDGTQLAVVRSDTTTQITDNEIVFLSTETGEVLRTENPFQSAMLDRNNALELAIVWVDVGLFVSRARPTANGDSDFVLFDPETMEIIREYNAEEDHQDLVYKIAISSDGRYALSAGGDALVILWEVETGRLVRRFVEHSGLVRDIQFTSDGDYAISGSFDSTAIVWSIATGRAVLRLTEHTDNVRAITIHPETNNFISASTDGTVRFWSLLLDMNLIIEWAQHNRYIRDFSCEERLQYRIEPQCDA